MALSLVESITQVRRNINETYEKLTELMPNQVDRDFSAASAWADVDLAGGSGSYNETDDLSIAAGVAGVNDYCTLAVASCPTTIGKQYRLSFDLTAQTGVGWAFQSFGGTHVLGSTAGYTAAARYSFTFRALTTGGLRIVANANSVTGTFDNFSLVCLDNCFWSDDEITEWIKEGTRVFSSKSLMVEAILTINPMILTTPYYDTGDAGATALSTALEIYAVIYKISTSYKGLIKVHPRQIGNLAKSAVTGPPKYYSLFNRQLYIFPLASATEVSGGTLDVLYAAETDDITDLADEYQHLPITYATAKALQKDQKFGQAGVLMQQFYQEISFERSDKHEREVDTIDDFKIKATAGAQQNARR